MGDRPLLDGLNERQRQAVTTPSLPLAILAGAGSGKTRVLTRRIAWQAAEGNLDPARTLAVTFTRKAAGELADRLGSLGVRRSVTTGTFHGLALGQLRRRWIEEGRSVPKLVERKVRLLAPMLPAGPTVAAEAGDVAGEIEWAKARLVAPDGYEAAVVAAGRPTPRPAAEVADLYARYEHDKGRRGLIDFDDLLWQLGDALEQDETFAAATRWRFRHLFVDEFQDVNPAQLRLLRAWLGGRPDLVVVGDDDQAIYGFTGADAGFLVRFERIFPGAALVRLEENYRSSPQILAAAGAVLPGGVRTKGHLRPTLPDGALPTIASYPSDTDEARGVARALQDRRGPGEQWSRFAVLYRTNAQSAPFEAELAAAGVPFRVRGAARFLDRPDVAAALEELRRAAAAVPGVGFSAHLYGLTQWAEEESLERRTHVDAVVRLGREYLDLAGPGAEDCTVSVDGFVAYLATILADEAPGATGDAVELLTFHKAKGLEWPCVFVTGLERGLVPIAYAETPAALAEERRLLYVAITRAESELSLSWAERRTLGARTFARQASPYLTQIEAALAAVAPGGSGDWRAAVAAERARLTEARAAAARAKTTIGDHADPAILAALVEWRRGLARASGVPAHVIFHDSTLAAVAEARPSNRDALLTVPGMGPLKVERFGEDLLALVLRHAS